MSNNSNNKFGDIMFPFDAVRLGQDEMVMSIHEAVSSGKHMLIHAPTGLGKTMAALAPVLTYAIENDKKVFFLTSRHTQHQLAIDAIKKIREKFNVEIPVASFIGKKWMCGIEGVENLRSGEFSEYCKRHKENRSCKFYEKLKSGTKLSDDTKACLAEINDLALTNIEQVKSCAVSHGVCPYEISLLQAKEARVVIGDYFYVFNHNIRNAFFPKVGAELEDSIVIVDEGHNLPQRVKDLASSKINSITLARGEKESTKYEYDTMSEYLFEVRHALHKLAENMKMYEERIVSREDVLGALRRIDPNYSLDQFIEDLETIAENVKEEKKQSSLSSLAEFFIQWQGEDAGYVRVLAKGKGLRDKPIVTLSYVCLDAAVVTESTVMQAHSVIVMSGTLNPPDMYQSILGFDKANSSTLLLENPFPDENRLNMIVPLTTTKYAARNETQFKRMGKIVSEIGDRAPGNVLVFFPSYALRDLVYPFVEKQCEKKIILEQQGMTKTQRENLLLSFKDSSKTGGALMLAVASGSFGEGIDLMGDLLECVVVVGLPLQKPDLKTKAAIEYYDNKFGRGWDFGYVYPAFSVCLQNAGRCIRSEKDRGVLIFLDERFAWPNYGKCFPRDWEMKVTTEYLAGIDYFFG